ncbi:MAG: hypothetical protein ACI8S6_001280 [Myxococcota bacterium]|jgi:hypothetical protein
MLALIAWMRGRPEAGDETWTWWVFVGEQPPQQPDGADDLDHACLVRHR